MVLKINFFPSVFIWKYNFSSVFELNNNMRTNETSCRVRQLGDPLGGRGGPHTLQNRGRGIEGW